MNSKDHQHQQFPLFHEDIYDALRTVVAAIGGPKSAGVRLRPELEEKPDQAARWLHDCLNVDRHDKLSLEQVLMLLREGRRAGCHVAMHFIAHDSGYGDPQPVEPEDEFAQLQRKFLEGVQLQQDMVKRMEVVASKLGTSRTVHRSQGEG